MFYYPALPGELGDAHTRHTAQLGQSERGRERRRVMATLGTSESKRLRFVVKASAT